MQLISGQKTLLLGVYLQEKSGSQMKLYPQDVYHSIIYNAEEP